MNGQGLAIGALLIGLGLRTACAAPFTPDWSDEWRPALGENLAVRHEDGSLELDYGRGQHVYFAGGEDMHDFAVTAKLKFLRADDKYSGFSIYLRYRGDVWAQRGGYWVYLRPKFRELYMQRMVDGALDKEFPESIEAVRPNTTPLNEWMTLRCEARGNTIAVYLNDELHLSATDDSRFPILNGRVLFGVGDAHVILADLAQQDLEQAEKIEGITYKYINPPTRGDEGRDVLTDGTVNPRAEQAFWRMLGPRPEIELDLGAEYFVTRACLRAVSSPATNIAQAEIHGSADGDSWETLGVLRNTDTRRAESGHEIAGEVRRIARYIRLILARPAADQDVELAEVEFYGREPTEADRTAAVATAYDIGPEMPPASDAEGEDDGYWYLQSETGRFAIDRAHGLVAGGWNRKHGVKCIERLPDRYYLYTRDGDTESDEYADEVQEVISARPRRLHLRCENSALPHLRIEKEYSLSSDGKRLIKRVRFVSTSDRPDRFLTHGTGGVLAEEFRRGGVYMGGDRGLGSRLFADQVTLPMMNRALGSRNSKTVLFIRYDLGWGVAQYRYKINDQYCRPLTSRWHEKENHPPIYTPTGWEMGLCTVHLAPEAEQSTETHLTVFDGRQYDFYGMYRELPEVAAQYESIERPAWVRDIKTSCSIALNPLSEDLTGPLLPIKRTLQMTDTGYLWDIQQIHGVWGDWFTEGVMTNGYGARIDTRWLKRQIAAARELSPRIKQGVYTWAWAVHPRSRVYQEHPEWFITTDRDGQVFSAYSNMVLNHARRLGIKESMDELMGQFEGVIRDFGGDCFYLDGGGGGQNLIDWEHLGCDQDYHYDELYRRIREVTRDCGRDKAVWFNARTGPYWDIGYYEGIDQRLTLATWRESADGFAAVKIRQAYDPDQVVVPLYWRLSTMPFFSNYCIGLGITPSRPLGADEQRAKLPFIEAAYETRKLQWIEADLQPDWRTDPETEIEAYALRLGDAAVLSVVDHREDGPGHVRLSGETARLGLDVGKPIYAWTFGVRDVREAWPALPEGMRREVYRRDGWGLDLAMRLLDVAVIEDSGPRIELTVPTEPQLLRMVILSHCPAGIFSVGGLRTNLWFPESYRARVAVARPGGGDGVALDVTAPVEGAEVVACAPPGKWLQHPGARSVVFGGHQLLIVPHGPGSGRIALETVDPPRPGGELRLDLPEQLAAGQEVPLDGLAGDLVSLWRNGALVAAGEVDENGVRATSENRGATALRIPEEVHSGTFTVQVSRLAEGALATARQDIEITGDHEPDLVPTTLPRTKAALEVAEVNREIRNLRVLSAATDSYDGYDGTLFAGADPDGLLVAGGNVDAPRTRYGYGFGGLELEGRHVLRLEIHNTFFDAWTFYRDRVSYHPTYTSTFAGMMVDYHTPAGYSKRVALGLGLINPKRQSPRPTWGCAAAPTEFINLADAIHQGSQSETTVDLSRWAPPDWDGRYWLSAGAENVLPSRRISVRIREAFDSAEGREITRGESVGNLYRMRTHRVVPASEAPTIDGDLGDAAWTAATPIESLFVFGRLTRETQNTRAWLVYDDESLYVAFDCPETEKKQLNTAAKKIWNQDAIDFALDVDADRQDFQQFIVNCAGGWEQFTQGAEGRKVEWDIRAAAVARDGGYAVEVAIPWSEMGVRPAAGMKWAANFVRYRPTPTGFETQTWSPLPGPSLIVPERFGELVFE